MSLLLWIWLISLLVLCAVCVKATHVSRRGVQPAYVPHDISDLVRREIMRMRYEGGVIINGLRPHGKSIVRGSYRILRRGHDIFIERVYGRIRIDKGRASSFFLKQIAEHQEKGAGHKRGL